MSEIQQPFRMVCGMHTEFGDSAVWDFDIPQLYQQLWYYYLVRTLVATSYLLYYTVLIFTCSQSQMLM